MNKEKIKLSVDLRNRIKDNLARNYLKRQYGLETEDYIKLIKLQKNRCAICDTDFDENRPFVDHCHISGIIRGLLCSRCNSGLGQFGDSVYFLSNAIAFLISAKIKIRIQEEIDSDSEKNSVHQNNPFQSFRNTPTIVDNGESNDN